MGAIYLDSKGWLTFVEPGRALDSALRSLGGSAQSGPSPFPSSSAHLRGRSGGRKNGSPNRDERVTVTRDGQARDSKALSPKCVNFKSPRPSRWDGRALAGDGKAPRCASYLAHQHVPSRRVFEGWRAKSH
jgi:hypothetical protein